MQTWTIFEHIEGKVLINEGCKDDLSLPISECQTRNQSEECQCKQPLTKAHAWIDYFVNIASKWIAVLGIH